MDIISRMDALSEVVVKELDSIISKGTMSVGELKIAFDAVCLLMKIAELEDKIDGGNMFDEGYSERNSWPNQSSYSQMRNPSNGRFMTGGRMFDSKRSGHSIEDRMIEALEGMMDIAKNDYERQAIRSQIESLRK